jgi:hypothetical protein
MSLVVITSCTAHASLHHHDVRGNEKVDLAFVSPAGGSALPVGQAFELALQVLQMSHKLKCCGNALCFLS